MSTTVQSLVSPAIPYRPSANGVRSQRRIRRFLTIYAGVALLGYLPTLLGWSAGWRAFGLGLWYPGGGLLALGGWGYLGFAVTVAFFVAGLLLWFLTGNMLVPMGIWGGTALLAGAIAGGEPNPAARYVVPLLALATIVWRILSERTEERRQLVTRNERNAYLPEAMIKVDERAARAIRTQEGERELSPQQLAATRFLLDRALQPLAEFGGFDVIDQFQTAALRYQLTFSQFALAVMQRHYTPAFHGYLSTAQRNLIDKMTDPRVWKYWILESLWGNLSLNFDPASRDNIMLGGFFNANVSLYSVNTGDRRYFEPGSLTFRLNERRAYRHDVHSLAKAAAENFETSSLCLYPCEPHLSYTFCNTVGFNGLLLNDRLLGTRTSERVYPDFRKAFEEDFMTLDGETQSGRMRPTGLVLPRFNGLFQESSIAWITTPFFPDIARRTWAIIREEFIRVDAQGQVELRTRASDGLDTGNYRKSKVSPYAHTFIAAREHGDEEMAELLLSRIDLMCGLTTADGVLRYPNVSHYFHAFLTLGRLLRRGDWAAMIGADPQVQAGTGPILTECSYPDVLVAKAYSAGETLSLVLYPSDGGTRQSSITVGQLTPGRRYRCCGSDRQAEFRADAAGKATIEIVLDGRTALEVQPASG